MLNKFDSSNYPTQEPRKLVAGERWAWTRPDITEAYPTADYTLEYRFCLQEASHSHETFQASKVDSAHVVELSSSTTEDYGEGLYYWQAAIIRDSDSEEVVVSYGYVMIDFDMAAHPGDTRSLTYKTLQAIQATIAGTATKEQKSYKVAGREVERRSIEELLELEAVFKQRWNDEQDAVDRANGRQKQNKDVRLKLSGR